MTQVNVVVADYWYSPDAGYFVVQDRFDTYQTLHERIEMPYSLRNKVEIN